ncbi:MAG: DUF4180 domain-containing protein [Chryseobacterium sp.]|nr:DUF4180 domain-containing protein [Chryseobacterium sp.]
MEIKTHIVNEEKVAEIVSDEIIINSVEDALDLVGNIYYQGFDKLVISEKNLTSEFFDLKNKLAGDILQKFSNYRMRLAIIGDFKKYESQSLRDFILESNEGRQINFVETLSEALT